VRVYIVHCRGSKVGQGFSSTPRAIVALAGKLLAPAAEDEAKEPIAR
jgi:hypothetical protein